MVYSDADPMVQATVTIASLVGTSIGEAQKVCPDIGPIYNYVLNNELPEDDKLARKIVLESNNNNNNSWLFYSDHSCLGISGRFTQ